MMKELICVGGVHDGKKFTVDTRDRDYAFIRREVVPISTMQASLSVRYFTYIKFDVFDGRDVHTVLVPHDQKTADTIRLLTSNYVPAERLQLLEAQVKHLKEERDILLSGWGYKVDERKMDTKPAALPET